MRVVALLLVGACVLGACGPSAAELERKSARLDRELRQAKAAERSGMMPLEPRTADFSDAIAQAEARHELLKLEEEMKQRSGRTSEEIEARRKELREILDALEKVPAAKPE